MRLLALALTVLLAFSAFDPAAAQRGRDRGQGHNEAREAVRAGKIKPLNEVLAQVGRRIKGRVVDVQLNPAGAGWVYRIKVLGPRGRVRVVTVDGQSGRVLGVDGGG